MVKIAVVGDLHLSMGTESRELPVLDTITKLEFIRDYCAGKGINDLILLGDFWDNLKQYFPSTLILKVAHILREFGCVYFLMGNHDYHKALGLGWKDEPIGLLMGLVPQMSLLVEQKIGNYTLIGKSWKKDYDQNLLADFECPEGYDPQKTIIAVHAYLLPKSENVMMKFHQLEDIENPVNTYLVGHYHKRLGFVQTENTQAVIPGSLTRIKSSESHNPAFFVLDLGSDDLYSTSKLVEIPIKDGNLIFKDMSEEKQIKRLNEDIKDFVKTLNRETKVMTHEDFSEAFAEISAIDFPEDSIKLNSYANHILDKSEI